MPQPEATESVKFDPRNYIAIFVFRWKMIAVCILLFVLGGMLYVRYAPRKYLTKCAVMIWRDPTLTLPERSTFLTQIPAYIRLLNSDELQGRVVNRLRDEWRSTLGGNRNMRLEITVVQERTMGNILHISTKCWRGDYAEAYIAALWEEFLNKQSTLKKDFSKGVLDMLEAEIKSLKESIDQAEDDVIEYQRLNAFEVTAARGSIESRYLMALLSYQNMLDTELMLLDVTFPMIANENATVISDADMLSRRAGSVTPVEGGDASGARQETEAAFKGFAVERVLVDSPDIQRWQSSKVRRKQLEVMEKDALAKFTPQHEEVRNIRRQMEELDREMQLARDISLSRLSDRYKALKMARQALDRPVQNWKNTYQRASQKQAEYRRKTLAVDRQERMYTTLFTRKNDLQVSEELKADQFGIIEHPNTQDRAVWPDPVKVMFVAIMLALGSGFGLAIVTHVFDNKMQTISDVQTILGLPFLGGIPRWVRSGEEMVSRPIVVEEHASGAVEAYRVLRTSLLAALDKAGQKVVLFTSAESKEGKTITVLNLAVMTAKVGKKVLLVDMDLRRPRLHRSFKTERSPGVSDALAQKRPLEDFVVATDIENLWFIPGGSSCEDAAELLQAADLKSLFAGIKEQYDCIFIDTCPVLRAADASILASPELCSVVFISKVDATPKPLIKYSLDMLANAHILGVVMNSIDMTRISSLYYSYQYPNYAYYAYAYAYGYQYDYYADGLKVHKNTDGAAFGSRLRRFYRRLRRDLLPVK